MDKKLFVFTALLFSKNLLNLSKDIDALVGFIIFCMITGCAYMINDLVDLEKDKLHPTKSQRPIASGRLNKTTAIKITTIICLVSLSFAFYINSFLELLSLHIFTQYRIQYIF